MAKTISEVNFYRPQIQNLKKVAAYARVSSGKDAMLHSLSAQVDHYKKRIISNPEWAFAGIYADEAVTGTKEKRDEFQRMLTDCRNGKIDMIITKSISRFARNTVVLLETARELKELGIDIWFEEQNIHTMSANGELMLTILSSFAQEESRSVSENMKWHYRKGFEQGIIGTIRMLGYRRTPEGSLEIIPEEAEIVRLIYDSYISGRGYTYIANMLNEMRVPTVCGGEWHKSQIYSVLTNEKYTGVMLLQKYYIKDHISKKKVKNNGELAQHFVSESHDAIISEETFQLVERLIKEREEKYAAKDRKHVLYPFSGMIECQYCKKHYRRKTTTSRIVWICTTFNTKGKRFCPTAKQIPETTLIDVCCDILGLQTFDENVFSDRIRKIAVPGPNKLVFHFTDGTTKRAQWEDRSRSASWTDEMRRTAAERKRNGKNSHNNTVEIQSGDAPTD